MRYPRILGDAGYDTNCRRFTIARGFAGVQLVSIVPYTLENQDRCTVVITSATGDGIVPGDRTSIRAPSTPKSEGAISGVKFEGHRVAQNETAGRKCSRINSPRGEAGCIKSGRSGDCKASLGTGACALSEVGPKVKAFCVELVKVPIHRMPRGGMLMPVTFPGRRWHNHP